MGNLSAEKNGRTLAVLSTLSRKQCPLLVNCGLAVWEAFRSLSDFKSSDFWER